MSFSATVKLADLNDYLAPSQACVIQTTPESSNDSEKDKNGVRCVCFV